MTTPLVQLYCKKLTLENLDGFLGAGPEHIGWQLNFAKLQGDDRARAVEQSARIAERLKREGTTSVFLIHPSTDAEVILAALAEIKPNIFLTSAARDEPTLTALAVANVSLMVPVGVPACGPLQGYDPLAASLELKGRAAWMTTDTITSDDTPDAFGCSGQTSDWTLMGEIIRSAPVPVVAAGGLTADNVAALWALCQPAGMDAHTAVCTNGVPDLQKARRFTQAVRTLS